MLCDIFTYGSHGLCGIECNSSTSDITVVFIPGLTEGFLQPSYVPDLSAFLGGYGVRFFQPMLRSSYGGWGSASLESDAADLGEFIEHIRQVRSVAKIVLIGHSTGCQGIIHCLKCFQIDNIHSIILQGAVSDRQAWDVACEGNPVMTQLRQVMHGKALETDPLNFLPREAGSLVREGDVLTAERFLSLNGTATLDDMFSSDLSDDYQKKLFLHIKEPVLIVQSLQDEFIPKHIDPAKLALKISRNFPRGACVCIPGDHGLKDADFLGVVGHFLCLKIRVF